MSAQESHMEFYDLIARYLSGELSKEELDGFEKLLHNDPEKRNLLEEYRKTWESIASSPKTETYDLDSEWELLKVKIPGFETSGFERTTRSLRFYAYRIAAVLVVGVLLTFAWIYGSRMIGTERVVAQNDPVEVHLDDGTTVLVNRNSKIRYRNDFSSGSRKVYLSGEAWFDVSRDSLRPFTIEAGAAMIEVLGTSFNVNAYRENSTVEITVESGVVALTSKQDKQEQIVLRAGNGGTLHKQKGELELIPTSNPNSISWKTRELYFDNTPLQEVAELINKVYNSQLVIPDADLGECTITVTFRDQSLEAVLRVLEMTLDLKISHTGDEIEINGEGCVE